MPAAYDLNHSKYTVQKITKDNTVLFRYYFRRMKPTLIDY